MSLHQHETAVEQAVPALDWAARSALGSAGAEGLEPDEFGMALLEAVCAGELTTDEAVERALAHYTA